MKSQFPGHFPLSEERIKVLWDDAIFVFDTNILLGLYRYSDATRNEFFETLRSIKERCWLPHQAVKEYFDNRLKVIGEQEASYSGIIKAIDEIEDRFNNHRQHPFLSEQILKQLCENFETARQELDASKEIHTERITQDDVMLGIEEIFGERIGGPYSDDELATIVSEGEERYKEQVPPGVMDSKKEDPTDHTKKYGDLILWKQILEKVNSDSVGIIFVTDDRKEDWWARFKGKTLGPRPELVKEFKENSDQDFYMYEPHRFLEFAGSHFDRKVSEDAISEMKNMEELNDVLRSVHENLFGGISEKLSKSSNSDAAQARTEEQIEELYKDQACLELKLNDVKKQIDTEEGGRILGPSQIYVHAIESEYAAVSKQIEALKNKLQWLELDTDGI